MISIRTFNSGYQMHIGGRTLVHGRNYAGAFHLSSEEVRLGSGDGT